MLTVLGINVARDREKGTITINQRNLYGRRDQTLWHEGLQPRVYAWCVARAIPELAGRNTARRGGQGALPPITLDVMHLGQISRYDVLSVVNQLAKAMSESSEAHMGAAKRLLCYLGGFVNFSTTYKRVGFKLADYLDVNWGNNPDNGRSTSSHIAMLANGPTGFKVGRQSLSVQSTMGAALIIKEAVFWFNMMVELGFDKAFSSIPLYVGNTSTLHVSHRKLYILPLGDTHCTEVCFVQELVEEDKSTIHYVNTGDIIADLGIKPLGRHCHRTLIKLINNFET